MIHHVSIKCALPEEYERVKDFYCGLLGMRIHTEWQDGMMLDAGNGRIEVFRNGPGIREKGALRHIAFAVRDPDALCEAVRKAGYEVFEEPKDIEVPCRARIAFVRGPLGEEIEFFREYTEKQKNSQH